jgi:hypothetical protein
VHGGRIDTLGLDDNNCPVIIEYKHALNENVISQGLLAKSISARRPKPTSFGDNYPLRNLEVDHKSCVAATRTISSPGSVQLKAERPSRTSRGAPLAWMPLLAVYRWV